MPDSERNPEGWAERVRCVYGRVAGRYDGALALFGLLGYRTGAYRRRAVCALRLRPGQTVVDLGCGTPVHAVVRSGNRRFYAAADDGVYEGAAGDWHPVASWYDWPAALALLAESDGTVSVGTEQGVVTFREDDPEVEPDTLDWHGYFPLEVGNVWQYDVEVTDYAFGTVGEWIEQWEVTGDTTFGGRTFFRLDMTCDSVSVLEGYYIAPCGPDEIESNYMRYDETAANLEIREGENRPWHWTGWHWLDHYEFRLDAPFYYEDAGPIGFAYFPVDSVRIGGETVDAGIKGITVWDAVPGGFTFAHGIGLVAQGFYDGGGLSQRLRYVRTSSVELGHFFNVATEWPPPSRGDITLEAYPNPVSDAFAVELNGAAAGTFTLELFDVLGRRVRTLASEFVHSDTWRARVSAARLGAGVYYMIATVDGRTIARRELVVMR